MCSSDLVNSVAYSPGGRHIISGSSDRTIRIWDAETGAIVGNPLNGHTDWVWSVACSPNGRHIISGSRDRTIRIWDAETGAAVGNPLERNTLLVWSVAYSPDVPHIISGYEDRTFRTRDDEADTAVGKPLWERTYSVQSIARSPNGKHIVSGSYHNTIRVLDAFPYDPIRASSGVCGKPDKDGWVKDSEGGLLYWVPHDCRAGLHSPGVMTISRTSHGRSVSLDFDDFAFGVSWTQIFKIPHP